MKGHGRKIKAIVATSFIGGVFKKKIDYTLLYCNFKLEIFSFSRLTAHYCKYKLSLHLALLLMQVLCSSSVSTLAPNCRSCCAKAEYRCLTDPQDLYHVANGCYSKLWHANS
uniref:Uncharacterized protein n=1 Tax=Sphaerodactylus townsendi TaxID=933632 RepID=A0ACB8F614_9SAUR